MERPIRLEDFNSLELTGTTHGTADTQRKFRHGLNVVPVWWVAVEGDVYIPRHGLSPTEIDVRSRLTSQQFKLILFY